MSSLSSLLPDDLGDSQSPTFLEMMITYRQNKQTNKTDRETERPLQVVVVVTTKADKDKDRDRQRPRNRQSPIKKMCVH